MFIFHFINFVGTLDIQAPTHDGIPPNSPIIIDYKERENLSKHEILRRFNRILTKNNITYLRPVKSIGREWLLNLQELKYSFNCLKNSDKFNTSITIEPEYFQHTEYEEFTDRILYHETTVKFSIYPEDILLLAVKTASDILPKELEEPLERFRNDHNVNEKCGFLMMKFEDSKLQRKIVEIIKTHFANKGIRILRADDKWYADDLFENIKTYMHGCNFGIALFERINSNDFNPNVSLEIGYMMAMNKPILFLKDKTLISLHTDLIGKLYYEYDFQCPEEVLPKSIDKWLNDKEI